MATGACWPTWWRRRSTSTRVFGGVVPEIASRKHIEAICGVCDEASGGGLGRRRPAPWPELAPVAVTYAPGLVGALVVGVAFAKGASPSRG